MTRQIYPPTKFEDFQTDYNSVTIDSLFAKYEEIGFLYPEKRQLLNPYFTQIKENWTRLLESKEQMLWILTKQEALKEHFASISVWKNSNRGVLAQHLVSTGNPFLSLKVMLAAQFKCEHHFDSSEVISSQNWFRPNNRYAYRIFASMYDKLGADKASLMKFQYLHMPLEAIDSHQGCPFRIEEVKGIDPEFTEFVKRQYSSVFVEAEELDQEDLHFSGLNDIFQQYGLARSRKIIKVINPTDGRICASIVANRAPMGLNFSFLENRAYYILDKALDLPLRDMPMRYQIIRAMNTAIQPFYQDFPLGAIPIVTDESSSEILQLQQAKFLREYMQSIWMREGFAEWYQHILSFLKKIERRTLERNAA